MIQTIAVMTSGGDSPGMNAAVRAVVRRALDRGVKVLGIKNGYEGLIRGEDGIVPLQWRDVGGILPRGGTFLGTARSERFRTEEGRMRAVLNMVKNGIEALIVIGGDGSLMGAHTLATEWSRHIEALSRSNPDVEFPAGSPQLKVLGLPGSIDNDLTGTDMSIGADTALNHIVHAMDDLASTAASHQRTFVVETMGRHCGYLALASSMAGGASWVLVPEEELDLRWHQKMVQTIGKARETGRPHQMVMVAEGARHPDGLLIDSGHVKKILAERLGIDVRLTVLGHIQRGGAPTAFDRLLATRLGVAAVDMLLDSEDADLRHMLGLVRNKVAATPLIEVVENSNRIRDLIEDAEYAKVQELRGESFKTALDLVKTLNRITPKHERREDSHVAIVTGGADAPGMNVAVSVAARYLLNHGIPAIGSVDGFLGAVRNEFIHLDWNEMVGWMNRPGSELGTARLDLSDEEIDAIAANFAEQHVKGLIAVGGLGTVQNLKRLADARSRHHSLRIPIVHIPASIDNNIAGTDYCVGVDTALNNIVEAVDKIRDTAGASRRAFIVEVMGRGCGFLSLMSALATGAEKAYLPETGISLSELNVDVENLKRSFESGKRMVLFMKNEFSSFHYTTDFIRRILEEESKEQFEVRTAILGHVQRGGLPSAFDRILATRMAAAAATRMIDRVEAGAADVDVVGLSGPGVGFVSLKELLELMDWKAGRPKNQWFMQLIETARSLAKFAPAPTAAQCVCTAPRDDSVG